MLEYFKEESKGFEFFDYGDDYAISEIGSFTGDFLVIPESVEGKPLTTILKFALRGAFSIAAYIPESVKYIGEGAFQYCNRMIIFCEAKSKPGTWNANWNYSECPVVWDCKNNDVATDGCIYTACEGVLYKLSGSEATVCGQSFGIKEAKIASRVTYKGLDYAVTSISEYAFADCHDLSRIEIPPTLKKIGKGAFYNCSALSNGGVHISDIKSWCSLELEEGSGETSPLYHGKSLYINGELLRELVIPADVTKIASSAFCHCLSLTSVRIPATLKELGKYAFAYADNLTEAYIEDGVEYIGDEPFSNCGILTVYCEAKSKPDSWSESWNIDGWSVPARPVVWDCKNNDVADDGNVYATVCGLRYRIIDGAAILTAQPDVYADVIFPEAIDYKGKTYGVTEIDSKVYYYAENIRSIDIRCKVTEIPSMAFYYCESLEKIKLPDSIKVIGFSAFNNCTNLKEITIPKNTEIQEYAFDDCYDLHIRYK